MAAVTPNMASVNPANAEKAGTYPHDSAHPDKANIAAALAEDAKCRHPGVTEGLYGLAGLPPFRRLDVGVPMIRGNRGAEPLLRAGSVEEFRQRLKAVAPFLETLDFQQLGLRLAGGAASGILMQNPAGQGGTRFHDFDIFLVGHKTDLDAKKAITALGRHLAEFWAKMEVYRTQNCITFYSKHGGPCETPAIVQVILRRYSTEAEIVHGFDMGSSAVLWDGQQVRMTALGRLAAVHGVNVLNLVARRASYESRLARYFDRGFDLVLPDLDGATLLHNGGRLPYLYARGVQSVCPGGCCVTAWFLAATRPELDDRGLPVGREQISDPEERPESDYAFGRIAYGKGNTIVAQNVRALAQEKTAALCAFGVYGPDLDIFGIQTYLDPQAIHAIINDCFKVDGSIRVTQLAELLGRDAATSLFLDFIEAKKRPSQQIIAAHTTLLHAALIKRENIPFRFMTVEDKTALTGPFTREVVSAKDWYGGAFRGL
jgi:hypothetical protein